MERYFNIGSINARTLAPRDKQIEFELALSKIKWDVVAVQEARIVGLGSFSLTSSGATVFHSGGATASRGVAFVLRAHLVQNAVFRGLTDRLATLALPQERIFLVCAYAPTSAYDDRDYDSFLDQVDAALRSAPRGYMPVLTGDFNCRVAREPGNHHHIGLFASQSPNARGQTFTESCVRNGLRCWNTFLKKRSGRLWTWRSPNGRTFSQIDYILAPPSAPVVDCGVIGPFQFDSDHRLVRMTLLLSQKTGPRRVKPLARAQTAQDAYYSIVAFAQISATSCWRIRQSPPWISPTTRRLLSTRHRLRARSQNTVAFSIACKTTRAALCDDIRRRKETQANRAAILGRSIVHAMRDLHSTRKRLLVPDPITGALSQEATLKSVKRFYETLYTPEVALPLAVPPSTVPLPLFLADECRHALSLLKRGHSAGSDRVLPDMLNISRECLAQPMADLLNRLVAGDDIPPGLVEAVVTLLYKKGDPSDISNFRPISLLTVTLKTITRAILQRIEASLDESESLTQTGFRKGHSTLNNLHAIKQLAERTCEYKIPLYLAFVDYTKAFDCVEWSAVWEGLWNSGVHPTLIHLLRRLYESSSTLIRVNEDLVPVTVRRGVRQGDTLSPRLFNVVLKSAMDDIDWESCGIKIDGRHLSHLEYADDVVLVAKTRTELGKMLRKLIEASARVGLKVNASKTVLLTSCTTTRSPIHIDNQVFHFVQSAMYLGGKISLPLDPSADVEHRIRLGWAAWSKLSYLLASRILPMKNKRRLFDSCIKSTVLYGCETWALRSSDKERLDVTLRKMERRMVGVTLRDRIRNERLREITRVRDWNKEALKMKAKWALKVRTMDTNNWTRAATVWTPYSRARPQGHPKTRWRDDLKRAIGQHWWNAYYEEYRPLLT